jgi:Na+-translocating ferredoxin:NAD+ oxidoreductase RnfC subunit
LLVQESEKVLVGQPLFFAKENDKIQIGAPVSGTPDFDTIIFPIL